MPTTKLETEVTCASFFKHFLDEKDGYLQVKSINILQVKQTWVKLQRAGTRAVPPQTGPATSSGPHPTKKTRARDDRI